MMAYVQRVKQRYIEMFETSRMKLVNIIFSLRTIIMVKKVKVNITKYEVNVKTT